VIICSIVKNNDLDIIYIEYDIPSLSYQLIITLSTMNVFAVRRSFYRGTWESTNEHVTIKLERDTSEQGVATIGMPVVMMNWAIVHKLRAA
jgi:hypothetical protein